MTHHPGVAASNTAQDRPVNVIEVDGLTATYSTGCMPTGEWFALGTIVRDKDVRAMPAWVVVGTGETSAEAIDSLALEVQRQAHTSARA